MLTTTCRATGMLLASALLAAQGPASPPVCHDLTAISAIGQELVGSYPGVGASIVIEQYGGEIYSQSFGTFTGGEVLPIMSGSKTLSAAVLMTLVDDGLLSIDDPVGRYLPEWDHGVHATITLRMCFTHTSGLPADHPVLGSPAMTLRQAAAILAGVPLVATPGTTFEYGGVSMLVAGAVCEVVGGKPWEVLFAERIARPLGMRATSYDAFGSTDNPRIDAGARSSRDDYAVFVRMLRNRGRHLDRQVLSAASVGRMLSDQTSGLPVVATPHPDSAPYGIGIWLDRRDAQGRALLASCIGAFGFVGWVDLARDASGVFHVALLQQLTQPFVQDLYGALDDALLPAGVSCFGEETPACAGGGWLTGDRRARAGDLDFTLLASRAPAVAIGAFVLGTALPNGLSVGDLHTFVGPDFDVLSGVVADMHGRARLAAPLLPDLAGGNFAVQAVWFGGDPCTQLGLSASHGLRIDVP